MQEPGFVSRLATNLCKGRWIGPQFHCRALGQNGYELSLLGPQNWVLERALAPLRGCSREQSAAADLQCQSHLRIDVSCIGAQRRERHAEETNSFAHRKLRRK